MFQKKTLILISDIILFYIRHGHFYTETYFLNSSSDLNLKSECQLNESFTSVCFVTRRGRNFSGGPGYFEANIVLNFSREVTFPKLSKKDP